jgi:hypothetical protein
MAIVVLVLWLFTAGAGFYLLVTSNLARARPADQVAAAPGTQPAPAAAAAAPAAGGTASRRETRRATRDRWDPPSLVAARKAPIVPGARSLAEFAHPACGIVGLAFWLGFTLVHERPLGWIAFGLVAVTACVGLAWFTVSVRAARRGGHDQPAPSFADRLLVLHGSAAAVTITLAALTALVAGG